MFLAIFSFLVVFAFIIGGVYAAVAVHKIRKAATAPTPWIRDRAPVPIEPEALKDRSQKSAISIVSTAHAVGDQYFRPAVKIEELPDEPIRL